MRRLKGLAVLALAVAAGPAIAAHGPVSEPGGLWINPLNSVAVRTGGCGAKLCGWIVWASPDAQSDAREGGVTRLLGTELLQDYTADGANAWKGTVFVPDLDRRFSSRIDQLSPTRLRIKGCILGGLICKSQEWNRIGQLPHA